jgi:polysaccharide pyruvyl transferase CsaB
MTKIVIARMANADFNKGEEAILTSLLKSLSQMGDADITVLSHCPNRVTLVHNVRAVYTDLKNIFKIIRIISKSDLFIWGGGQMLQDHSSFLDVPYHLIRVFFAEMMGVPVTLYAVEIGPLDTKIGRFFARLALNKCDLIILRNKESKELLEKIGVLMPRIFVTADPSFLISPDESVFERIAMNYGIEDDRCIIGIAPRKVFYKVRGFLPATLRLKLNLMPSSFHLKYSKFKEKLAQIADYLIEKYNAKIIFIPMDVAKNPRDDLVCMEVVSLMKNKNNTIILKEELSPEEVAGIFKKMEFVIAQRLHALILATIVNVPVIGIAASQGHDKCRIYMNTIGQGSKCVDADEIIDDIKEEKVFRLIDDTWLRRKELKSELKPKLEELKKKSLSNAILVEELIKK